MKWDPQRYAREASFVPQGGLPVVDLLAPQPGERVLDLGCGEGVLTEELVNRGAQVVGVDSSPAMAEAARRRGLATLVCAAEELPYSEEFDAVFTSAALHWMTDQRAVLRQVHRALRPGGRFVGEFAGTGNLAAVGLAVTAAALRRRFGPVRNPWASRGAGEFAEMLVDAGFQVSMVSTFPRRTPLNEGLRNWLAIFGEHMLSDIPPSERAAVLDDAVRLAEPWMSDGGDGWAADYVRLRFSAARPE